MNLLYGDDCIRIWKRVKWASVVGLISAITTCAVFVVALVLALLCEFIITGRIGETVDDGFVRTGGRICGAMALLAFVVAFGVVTWWAGGRFDRDADGQTPPVRREEPVRPWRRA